jgi:CheY-like chemotaxis protein
MENNKTERSVDSKRSTILVVENDELYGETVKEHFGQAGYRTLVARNSDDAKRMLGAYRVDLAVVDIRLVDDADEKDVSGLGLAREINQEVPVIVLTQWPTVQNVREALAPYGQPAAIGFVSKEEGFGELLLAVSIALKPLSASVESRLLLAFDSTSRVAVAGKMQELGSHETLRRLRTMFDASRDELKEVRKRLGRQASQYHYFGMSAIGLGIGIIMWCLWLRMNGNTTAGNVYLSASVVTQTMGGLLLVQEKIVYSRMFRQLEDLSEQPLIVAAMDFTSMLTSPTDRDAYRKRVIDCIIERLSGSSARTKARSAAN